mmetsp:Transcript_21804/g.60680  ORF Transcript_21804/g.60680 Transcript_21804/m.60680 type:complete len:320 (-) Transcript_21804:84-1043(-)|eukprot:CAMPEP_0198119892 /NCGR_PEP_ID=MMETSP1442-20131203/27354_1 /TAXON_ID= /ORGANISM="Craspedostauros australis, Strain CCMP3328" /LENGTH=319 /DNA_ID=CAMNT_0043778449 /DNA_START=166 /DNA_END=1125 /DNA_ORIENTATION=+
MPTRTITQRDDTAYQRLELMHGDEEQEQTWQVQITHSQYSHNDDDDKSILVNLDATSRPKDNGIDAFLWGKLVYHTHQLQPPIAVRHSGYVLAALVAVHVGISWILQIPELAALWFLTFLLMIATQQNKRTRCTVADVRRYIDSTLGPAVRKEGYTIEYGAVQNGGGYILRRVSQDRRAATTTHSEWVHVGGMLPRHGMASIHDELHKEFTLEQRELIWGVLLVLFHEARHNHWARRVVGVMLVVVVVIHGVPASLAFAGMPFLYMAFEMFAIQSTELKQIQEVCKKDPLLERCGCRVEYRAQRGLWSSTHCIRLVADA